MADRLTQLQDCLEDLATQMFASLRYIQTHHSPAHIEGQPDQFTPPDSTTDGAPPSATAAGDDAPTNQLANGGTTEIVPDKPEVFQAALRELSRDLIMKEQQIEYLISVLPGIGTSEKDQNVRIEELEKELMAVDEQRKEAMRSRDDMLAVLGQLAASCKSVR